MGRACVIAGMSALCLAGCAVGKRDEPRLPFEVAERFSESGEAAAAEEWWRAFGDAELNRLVKAALQSNFDLASVWARLREAEAVARQASAELWPFLDGFASASRTRGDLMERAGDELALGLAAGYELDLWGRARSSASAADFRAEASLADYQAAALSLSAVVSQTWFRLVTAREQHDLLEEQLEANEKVLALIESRFRSGQTGSVDVLRQRQLIESTREQIYDSEARIQVLEHLLAVLLGRQPQETLGAGFGDLPELPELPEAGVPAELVRRRPDVRSAYLLLRAENEEVARAVAERFPRLTISGSVETTAEDSDALFEDWIRGIAGELLAPIFAGGSLAAEVERTKAVAEQRLAGYAQATLVAFQEVEDALVQERKQIERIRSLEEQVRLAGRAYEQLRVEYFNGVSNYIDVLTALTDEQQLQRDLLAARLALLEFRIALYRALAGPLRVERESHETMNTKAMGTGEERTRRR